MVEKAREPQPSGSKPGSSSSAPSTAAQAETKPGSSFWSSWISPSSSAANAASSALERRRRPTFEEFRAQEPPQARLLRLRGLFDKLLDKDNDEALAGGRAKNEWTASARRARYGAGGPIQTGSLADAKASQAQQEENSSSAINAARSVIGQSSSGESSSQGAGDKAPSRSSQGKLPPPPPMPKNSYAHELLAQCRECSAVLDRERSAAEAAEAAETNSSSGWGWGVLGWTGGDKEDPQSSTDAGKSKQTDSDASSSSSSSSTIASLLNLSGSSEKEAASATSGSSSSSLSSLSSLFGSKFSEPAQGTQPNHEGEAGWTGSGVWGLSAVGSKQREKDRERDHAVKKGQPVDDDAGARQRQIEWEGFMAYADQKEKELYKIFTELDKNGDMRLDVTEIRTALDRAGIDLPPLSLDDFIASLASSRAQSRTSSNSKEKPYVTFPEFRDYLLLLPRKPSVSEIFRFYQVRKAFGLFGIGGVFAEFGAGWGKTERGATAVNFDGDVSLAGEEKKKDVSSATKRDVKKKEKEKEKEPTPSKGATESKSEAVPSDSEAAKSAAPPSTQAPAKPEPGTEKEDAGEEEEEEEEEEDSDMIQGEVALKFLLAGGIAGAVSRTATAPFDRLKIYLITTARSIATEELSVQNASKRPVEATAKLATHGMGMLKQAVIALYREGGGLKAFWLGNGLNCVKIFPESAIKFLSYETSKRAFAKYVDGVSDSRDISGGSRFMSGGIGGITSQLAIYPVETLKTRLMSSAGGTQVLKGNDLLFATAKDMWRNGGMRTYYRGLTAGLVGVFPYSAIDMSTFEGIKLFYIKYTGREEPGVLALLAFGSVSGSVGATTVYPLNLVRTRLQAAGTPAHPTTYTGFADAVCKTYQNEGFVGFYRGLIPTLAKVVPAVSISYVVYEHSKRSMGLHT